MYLTILIKSFQRRSKRFKAFFAILYKLLRRKRLQFDDELLIKRNTAEKILLLANFLTARFSKHKRGRQNNNQTNKISIQKHFTHSRRIIFTTSSIRKADKLQIKEANIDKNAPMESLRKKTFINHSLKQGRWFCRLNVREL